MTESTSSPTSNNNAAQTTLTTLQTELSSLNRVSHKLAMTEPGPQLERVLNLLLPRLLSRIGKNDDAKKKNKRENINKRKSPSTTPPVASTSSDGSVIYEQIDAVHEAIHKKLIEMIGHTMKRVREDRTCKLPCSAILELLLPADEECSIITANSFTINLGLTFLTLGINRCTPVECSNLLPNLLTFLGCNYDIISNNTNQMMIGVGYLTDPSRKMRHDQTFHLILRCLESISHNPMENAAARRAAQQQQKSTSNVLDTTSETKNSTEQSSTVISLDKTKQIIASNPILAAVLFDLFTDIFLYQPVPTTSTLIPNGLSTSGYQRLISGAASEKAIGCKSWKEEFMTRGALRQLKLKLLDLIAPCRRFALFLSDVVPGNGANSIIKDGMGIAQTVALMVLLTGDVEPDVKSKAESYLKAHMDTYRGKDLPQQTSTDGEDNTKSEITIHDALLGNSVALAQTLMVLAIGGGSSSSIEKQLSTQYTNNEIASGILRCRLGLTYSADPSNATQQKAFLSCSRMKMSELSSTSSLNFVGKMLEDNPKLFQIGMDTEESESDVAAVSIGTLVLAIIGDLHRPGSSASQALESAASLLNYLCVRLSLFYDVRVTSSGLYVFDSLERIRVLLARSMKQACLILSPTSSGDTSSLGSNGTKASTTQIDIRDKCYGVVCTLSRSKFALDSRYALFDCGNSNTSTSSASALPLTTISAATLLFGCSSNEAEVMRPRATSALDALLAAYVRVVKLLAEKEIEEEQKSMVDVVNPWANITESTAENKKAKDNVSTEGLARSLLPLLWTAARRNQPKASRLAAARWSSELLLRLDDSNAFHLLCFLSGDDDATVSMIAKQALGVDKSLGEDNVLTQDHNAAAADTDEVSERRASFSALLNVIIGSQSSMKTRPTYSDFHVRAKAATIRFLLQSLFSEESFYGDEDSGSALMKLVIIVLDTFGYYKSRSSLSREDTDLIDECSVALASCTSTSKEARQIVVKGVGGESDMHYSFKDAAIQAILSNSAKARRHLAEVMGHIYEDPSLWGTDSSIEAFSITSWIEKCGLSRVAKICHEKLSTMSESSLSVGQIHGAAFLGASCVRAFRLAVAQLPNNNLEEDSNISDCWQYCCGIVSLLGKGLGHAGAIIGSACSNGLVIAFSYDSNDAPILNPKLFDAMAIAIDSMNTALKKYSSIDHADPTRSSSLIQAAGLLLAASTSGAGHKKDTNAANSTIDLGPERLHCTEALFAILGSAVYRKDDELALIVGEALVKYADALGSGEWSSGSDSEWKEGAYDESYAFELPPHRHVLYTIFRRELVSSNPQKKNACAATLLALIAHASRKSNIDPSFVQRSFVQEIWKHLSLFQVYFIKLLADPKSKQLSRESCCKGLAACRGLAAVMDSSSMKVDGESLSQIVSLNEELLKAFGQTTNYGGSMMQETGAQASQRRSDSENGNNETNAGQETQVGGAAGMSEATLGAYAQMASAAVSLGKTDILYSLMILATNHPLWRMSDMRDKYSAKALLGQAEGSSVEEIRISLRPHLGKLIPKLLRACNDPNKQTREQMNNLWLALSGGGAESRALITQNLLTTIDTLIEDAGSKLWRARVGASGALADIIVGRSWEELGGGGVEIDDEGKGMKATASIRLLRLWKITMRSLDDVRTAVRERGDMLGRGMRSLTTRLCDPTSTDLAQDSDVYLSDAQRKERERQSQITAEYAATVSLGWLVKYGLNQQCAEATGICISTLLGIVDVAKPSTLQPVLAELIGSLLMAMSGLEPAALNYLQVRTAASDAAASDNLERLRINAALSGPIAGALQKCLDMVKHVDLDAQRKLIPELDASLRKGAGFATRAATADAVGVLSGTCPAAFSFPGSTMSNPTVRLLRALYFASERERGATAKDKMTHALGSLAELAPGKAVRILALKACERYCESSGSNNDPSVRKAAAQTVRAIVVRASSHLNEGGPKDIWRKKVLPVAFLGRHDKDAKISSLWKDVWDEGGTAAESTDRDDVFGVLLQEKLLPYIVNATVLALQSTSWANRRAGCAVLNELTDANILAPTPRSTRDDNSLSAEDTNRLRQRAKASSILLSECVRIIARNRIWDGKGDVVKAGTAIAGKWSASALAGQTTSDCTWPLLLMKDRPDDLFEGDDWFKRANVDKDDINEDGCDDTAVFTAVETNGVISEDDIALDLSAEKDLADDEQPNGDNAESDVEEDKRGAAQSVVFSGLCKVLLDQAIRAGPNNSTEGVLPYKASAFSGLTALLKSVEPVKSSATYDDIIQHQQIIYDLVAPSLYLFVTDNQTSNDKKPPLLIARALECLAAAMYDGVGSDASKGEYANAVGLLKFFKLSTSTTPAWTVRQMSAVAGASLVAKMPSVLLRKNEVITTILDIASQTLKDKKFWKVRASGLNLLLSLVNRVGNQKMSTADSDKQLIMEAILPYKEQIIDVARKSLADNESQVTATASKITLTMAWWP